MNSPRHATPQKKKKTNPKEKAKKKKKKQTKNPAARYQSPQNGRKRSNFPFPSSPIQCPSMCLSLKKAVQGRKTPTNSG
jgi:hypothetical protein